jgi:SAM-dependent methyltransferase
MAPGSHVLDLACGTGRHALWLAGLGHEVLAVDRDTKALERLQAAQHAHISAQQMDLETGHWPLGDMVFDAIVVTHYLWRPLWPHLINALKPNGWVIYETFAVGNEAWGSPKRADFLLKPMELLEVFASFRVVAFEEGFLDAPSRVMQRIVAQKLDFSQSNWPVSPLKS